MSSLAELKKKMAMTFTEIKEDETWKARIGCTGNRPEDWLEYISHLKNDLADSNSKTGTVFTAYCEAIKAIDVQKHMENIHMVRLFFEYKTWKVRKCPEEVESMLKYARSTFRNFVIVHIEGAEFELQQGEEMKAERILQKAKHIRPRPYGMLLVALRNMAEGRQQLLTDDQKEECLMLEKGDSSSGQDSSGEVQFGAIKQAPSRFGVEERKDDMSGTVPLNLLLTQAVGDGKLHHYHSTPDCSKMAVQSSVSSNSKWKRPSGNKVFGVAMRVKRNTLPSFETEEDMSMDFKSFDDSFRANEYALKCSSSSSQDSSGEIIFDEGCRVKPRPVVYKNTVRFDIHEERKDDMNGTVPLNVISSQAGDDGKLRPYHSTPDCGKMAFNPSTLSSYKWKRPNSKKILGVPLRVKRNVLPSAIEKEESSLDNFQPLDSAKEHDVFDIHMHSSGYLSMNQPDISMSMETNSCNPPLVSQRIVPPLDAVVETEDNNSVVHSGQSLTTVKAQASQQTVKHGHHPASLTNTVQPASSTASVESKVSIPTVGSISAPSCTPVTPSMVNMEIITVNDQPYTKLNLLGTGGSAQVFHVFDSNKNSRALKCVDLSNANDMMKEGYMNEIRLLQRLQYCDSVIKMYDFEYNESQNKLYVVMERAETDLATFFQNKLKNKKSLDDKLLKFYWKEMLVAVEALHKEGIIHSDLKPANFILVTGNLKLIDFGIANAIQQDKTSVLLTMPKGTPNYISPETLLDSGDTNQNHKISTKSDIWSLGCILYNMVYGKTPFQDIRNCWSKLNAIKDPNHVIQLPPIQNENLLDVLQRCLNRDPQKRPSATQLLSHAYLADEKTRLSDGSHGTPVAASDVKRLLVQFSESSPRSIQALTKNLLEKLNSGQKINLNKIQVTTKCNAAKLDSA